MKKIKFEKKKKICDKKKWKKSLILNNLKKRNLSKKFLDGEKKLKPTGRGEDTDGIEWF
jgi:hypothetical protein